MSEEIDFDEASAEWMKNKLKLSGGWYAYRCYYIHSDGLQCSKACEESKKRTAKYNIREDWLATSVSRDPHHFCWQHRNRGPQQKQKNRYTYIDE